MKIRSSTDTTMLCHVVAMPYPGTGHINPMMNLCKLIASKKHDILITLVVTEEWLGFIRDKPKPDTVRFRTIPNVIPSEQHRSVDFPGFYEAVMMKMEAPFEHLLDQLKPPVSAIIGDVELRWPIGVGKRRNIPVAALWTMSASFFSMLYHLDVFAANKNSSIGLEHSVEIPGLHLSHVADLKTVFRKNNKRVLELALECISKVSKAQYLLFTSVYELEARIMDIIKAAFPFPVYSIGPAIPYLELKSGPSGTNSTHNRPDYLKWLDSQPRDSVLYISLGSFLSVSSTQMDEIIAGLNDSGVRYLWIARKEAARLKNTTSDNGLVLSWCDQLNVLCHPSVGGFWTHCGWNSILEAVFAGVPVLTFPLFLDQEPNSTQIVEGWRIGWKVKRETGEELVTREQIAELVRDFMDLERDEQLEMRRRATELRETCRRAVVEGGSSATNLDGFISSIRQGNRH